MNNPFTEKIKKIEKEVVDNRLKRNMSMSEENWNRFLNGENDIINNIFNQLKKILQTTHDLEISKQKIRTLKQAETLWNEREKEIEEFMKQFDLGWHEDCYTIAKKTFNREFKEIKK